ncbi:DUF2269 family protein [Pseudomonas japonica]|uniref:DUF2269 family protein n=1 Tax=Pseudomonas japonica TaxID=256466 RepID=UPI0015E28845|nr:DUF2269 domain-containing protein [Pseudomonas japonica]MBA1289536.1 DUF2269 domain-containing protein [Pseudomonas japonica]
MIYLWVKYLHIIAAVFLFGFGMGSFLYLIAARRTGDARLIAGVATWVVRFDNWITTPAGVLQLATGYVLASMAGWRLSQGWLLAGLVIFFSVGALWLPVLMLQKRMQQLAASAALSGAPLCERFHMLYRRWFWLGVAGFAGMFLIVLVMTTRTLPWAW